MSKIFKLGFSSLRLALFAFRPITDSMAKEGRKEERKEERKKPLQDYMRHRTRLNNKVARFPTPLQFHFSDARSRQNTIQFGAILIQFEAKTLEQFKFQ
jgi:hypothetical protein